MNAHTGPIKARRSYEIRKVLWIVFILNLVVAAAKYAYGVFSQSQAMQADGIHSAFDSVGNIVGLVGIAIASKPADADHPYGHSKFETYGSMIIGLLLCFAAYEVGHSAILQLVTGDFRASVGFGSYAVMVGTLVVNLLVTTFEHMQAKKLQSEILRADAMHTLSDALVSIAVIVGLVMVNLGFKLADPICALLVCVFIVVAAVGVFRRALKTLSDHVRIPVEEIQKIAASMSGIEEVHCIRTRGTESEIYCDLHLLVSPDMSVRTAHALGDKLEYEIEAKYPNVKEVLVHIEPYGIEQDGDKSCGFSVEVSDYLSPNDKDEGSHNGYYVEMINEHYADSEVPPDVKIGSDHHFEGSAGEGCGNVEDGSSFGGSNSRRDAKEMYR